MQIDDDRDLWLGMGYVLGATRFSVSVSKSNDHKSGFRVRLKVGWVREEPPLRVLRPVNHVLSMGGIQYASEWTNQAELLYWVAFIKRMDEAYSIRPMFHDQRGLHMFMWVFDNPPPSDYEEFLSWAEAFDSEEEAVNLG